MYRRVINKFGFPTAVRGGRTFANMQKNSRPFASLLAPIGGAVKPKMVGGLLSLAGTGAAGYYYKYFSSPGASDSATKPKEALADGGSDMRSRIASLKLLDDKAFENNDNLFVFFIQKESDLLRRFDDFAAVITQLDKLAFEEAGVRPNIMFSVQPDAVEIPEMATETIVRAMLYKGMRKKSLQLHPKAEHMFHEQGVEEFFITQSVTEAQLPEAPPLIDYVTGDQFYDEVVKKSSPEAPILVQFYEDSCFMCFLMRPFVNSMAVILDELGLPLRIKRLNIELNDFPKGAPITRGTPTFCLFRGVSAEDSDPEATDAMVKWDEFKPKELLGRINEEFFKNPAYVKGPEGEEKAQKALEKLDQYTEDVTMRMQLFTQIVMWNVEAQKMQNSHLGDHGTVDPALAEEKEKDMFNSTVGQLIEEDMQRTDNLPQNLARLRKEVDEAERDALFQAQLLGEQVKEQEDVEIAEHEKAFSQAS